MVAKVVGFPGFMLRRPKCTVAPIPSSAGLRRSASPMDTPPEVTRTSQLSLAWGVGVSWVVGGCKGGGFDDTIHTPSRTPNPNPPLEPLGDGRRQRRLPVDVPRDAEVHNARPRVAQQLPVEREQRRPVAVADGGGSAWVQRWLN